MLAGGSEKKQDAARGQGLGDAGLPLPASVAWFLVGPELRLVTRVDSPRYRSPAAGCQGAAVLLATRREPARLFLKCVMSTWVRVK